MQRIIAFFLSIIAFFSSLFGIKKDPAPQPEADPPAKVESIRAEVGCRSVRLNWSKADNAEYYRVLMFSDTTGEFDNSNETPNNYLTVTGLLPGKDFLFIVIGCRNENGKIITGENSDVLEVRTSEKPSKVKETRAVSVGETEAMLSWDAVFDADGYTVYSFNSSTKKYKRLAETNENLVMLENLEPFTGYNLVVRAFVHVDDSVISGPYSETLKITTSRPEGVLSVFERDVDWGEVKTEYYSGLQQRYNSPENFVPITHVRGYPSQPGDVSLGGTFILDEDDGGESIVFDVVAGRSYTVSTSKGEFYPGYHAKYGQVYSEDVSTGTEWYNAVDMKKAWNNKTSVTITPDFSGVCFVYLKNEKDNELVGAVTVTEHSADFNKLTTASRMNSLFDELKSEYPEYITRSDLGVCSDGVGHIFEYDFIPQNRDVDRTPLILIISGQHGCEKGGAYGLYFFFRDLCENSSQNETLAYLRENIAFKIIPVVNPYGWDKFSYYNRNGVNINRNYAGDDFNPYGTGTDNGGSAPFDQPETVIVKDFIERNLNAVLFIDDHTNTGDVAVNMKKVNWIDTTPNQNEFYNRIFTVCNRYFPLVKSHFNEDYDLGLTESDEFGTFTNGNTQYDENYPSADAWATSKKKVLSLTFEGFNGFPGEPFMYSDACLKANSEMIGNFIAAFVEEFSKEF